MKKYYRTTIGMGLFLAIVFFILGIVAAQDNQVSGSQQVAQPAEPTYSTTF